MEESEKWMPYAGVFDGDDHDTVRPDNPKSLYHNTLVTFT
jgi:hypothetical protein